MKYYFVITTEVVAACSSTRIKEALDEEKNPLFIECTETEYKKYCDTSMNDEILGGTPIIPDDWSIRRRMSYEEVMKYEENGTETQKYDQFFIMNGDKVIGACLSFCVNNVDVSLKFVPCTESEFAWFLATKNAKKPFIPGDILKRKSYDISNIGEVKGF